VIAINNSKELVFINTIAEALTGWKQEDALGKDLAEVFDILNEKTRSLIASPVQATREGVFGLPTDTTLLTKTGKAIPIAGSAAAIRDNKGNIIGAILVFRATDQPKQAQEVMQPRVGNGSKTTDDITLIQTFVQKFIQGEAILLSNSNLQTEQFGNTIQLLGKTEGLVVKAMLTEKPRSALAKKSSRYWGLVHQAMFAYSFFPIGEPKEDFYRYQHRPMPENYQMHCTDALDLWQFWVEEKKRNQLSVSSMEIIMLRQGTWKPLTDIMTYSYGKTLYIKTIGDRFTIDGAEMLIWGKKV
jgi:PAS domain S-box-containing protein